MGSAKHPMWILEDSCRHAVGCLAALALLTACDARAGNSDATPTSPASTSARAAVTTTTTVAAPSPAQGPRTEKWIDLEVGDCLADPPPSDPSVVTVSVVDCAIPHSAEVYLRADVEVNAAIADIADQECGAGFTRYTGQAVGGSPLVVTYLIDSNQDRTSANPLPSTVICLLAASNGGPLTGSARR
ncbi:MAG: hypothetical protein QOJ20_1217 [Mycobacterium sp.]|jgi:hypothetical protein|nr:hypothetical protein [Mycobacterium sp.]